MKLVKLIPLLAFPLIAHADNRIVSHTNELIDSPLTMNLWHQLASNRIYLNDLNFALDTSLAGIPETTPAQLDAHFTRAFKEMDALVGGAIANIDEQRQVGHYWLRNSDLAPNSQIKEAIDTTLVQIETLANDIHTGKIQGQAGSFKNLLLIGIGGSALGPQFVGDALKTPNPKLKTYFFDNTDPDTFHHVFKELGNDLGQTLVIVTSKSGSTPEPLNGLLETQKAYKDAGIPFNKHAIAITQEGSKLSNAAKEGDWITQVPMWDWVGGRTSELSAVGLLPAALQGHDIRAMLEGAKLMDIHTSIADIHQNPAAKLALTWYINTQGKGEKDMVIIPYKDRLSLFAKYLQQLIMESLGKEKDLQGNIVHQGISVYGNKGSTDQHAYIQQLRDGKHNFFATFIEVLKDRQQDTDPLFIEKDVTSGDYLHAFMLGTQEALNENGRNSITITIDEVNERSLGALIALYERAVGLYASVVNINAYNQPGVEAGKKAAKKTLELQQAVVAHLKANPGNAFSIEELAKAVDAQPKAHIIYKIMEHLSANAYTKVVSQDPDSSDITKKRFSFQAS